MESYSIDYDVVLIATLEEYTVRSASLACRHNDTIPHISLTPIVLFSTDLRLWSGEDRGAGRKLSHDPGGGDAVLPRPRDPDGGAPLRVVHRHMVGRLYLRRVAQSAHPLPGPESHTAGM